MYQNIEMDIKNLLDIATSKGEKANSIDFFLNTNYSPTEIFKFAIEYLDTEEFKNLRHAYGVLTDRRFTVSILTSKSIDGIIQKKHAFTLDNELVETTEAERREIIEFLQENAIPISSLTFIDGCLYYYTNKRKNR